MVAENAECRIVGYNLLIYKRTFQVKKVKSDNENASLWCVLGETKAAQAAQCSAQQWGKDRLVSLDIMKVKTEFEVSIFIYFQMI